MSQSLHSREKGGERERRGREGEREIEREQRGAQEETEKEREREKRERERERERTRPLQRDVRLSHSWLILCFGRFFHQIASCTEQQDNRE
jgi:hypothetical protein